MSSTREPGKHTGMADQRQATMRAFAGAVLLVLIVGVFLPLVGSIVSVNSSPEWCWDRVPFHAVVEVAGGLFALTLATILLGSRTPGSNQHHLWTSAALVGMGILGVAHGAVAPGETFVWFHSTATCVGGVLFALVWLPGRIADSPRCRLVLPLTGAAALAVCVYSLGFPRMIPTMVEQGAFTTTARALNILGGLGFLAAAGWFLNRYRVTRRWDDCLFACLCGLFGAAGVLFEFSSLWDAAWWWWHLLCLATYALATTYSAIAYQREIVERRRSEESLRESEAYQRALSEAKDYAKNIISSMSDIVVVVSPDGSIVTVNQAACDLLGYPEDELIGQPASLLFKEEDTTEIILSEHALPVRGAMLRRLVREGSVSNVEKSLLTRSGETIPVLLSGSVMRDNEDEIRGIVCLALDITQRKKTEEVLRIKDAAIASSINGIALSDLEGSLEYVNAAFLDLWGYDAEEHVLGRSVLEFWAKEEDAAAVVKDIFVKGVWAGELIAKRKDGTTFNAQLSANMVESADGKPLHMFASFLDITKRKQTEQQLEEYVIALEGQQRAMEKLYEAAEVTGAALAEKLEEVETFNRLAVGRELRMVELKEEVNGLLAERGKSPKYEIAETELTL